MDSAASRACWRAAEADPQSEEGTPQREAEGAAAAAFDVVGAAAGGVGATAVAAAGGGGVVAADLGGTEDGLGFEVRSGETKSREEEKARDWSDQRSAPRSSRAHQTR